MALEIIINVIRDTETKEEWALQSLAECKIVQEKYGKLFTDLLEEPRHKIFTPNL